MKDTFKVNSKENGLGSGVGSKPYPLHKQISESKDSAKKYGNNGLNSDKR